MGTLFRAEFSGSIPCILECGTMRQTLVTRHLNGDHWSGGNSTRAGHTHTPAALAVGGRFARTPVTDGCCPNQQGLASSERHELNSSWRTACQQPARDIRLRCASHAPASTGATSELTTAVGTAEGVADCLDVAESHHDQLVVDVT